MLSLSYDSLAAYLHDASTRQPQRKNNAACVQRHRGESVSSGSWYGEALPHEVLGRAPGAVDWLRVRYPHGAALIDRLRAELPAVELPQVKRALRYGPQGDSYDVHRALRGRVGDAWTSRPRCAGAPRTFTLAVNVGMRAIEEADALACRIAALAAVTDCLEAAGHRAEIWVLNKADYWPGPAAFILAVRIKAADAPLPELDSLTLPVVWRSLRLALAAAVAPYSLDPGLMGSVPFCAETAARIIGVPRVDFWINRGECESVPNARRHVLRFFDQITGGYNEE